MFGLTKFVRHRLDRGEVIFDNVQVLVVLSLAVPSSHGSSKQCELVRRDSKYMFIWSLAK